MRRAASALAVLALVSGCGSTSARHLSAKELGQTVLQRADLPPGFQEFDFGRQTRGDAHPGPRRDAARFGRQDGWKARYRSGGKGAALIESRVDSFSGKDGAKKDLHAYADEFDQVKAQGWRRIDVPRIGDETRSATLLQGPATQRLRYFTIAWRQGRLTASLTVGGFDRSTPLAEVVALARKQQARLARVR